MVPASAGFLDAYVTGGHAYLANYSNGLTIASLSSSDAPEVMGTENTSGNAYGVVVSSTYAGPNRLSHNRQRSAYTVLTLL